MNDAAVPVVMVSPLMCFLVGLLGALSATELVRVAAVRLRAVDQPGGRRVHRRPTPRLGGIGIAWGFACSLAYLSWVSGHAGPLAHAAAQMTALLVGAAFMGAVGHADDRWGLPSSAKLAACVAGALVLWAGGWRVDSIGLPGVGAWDVGAWSLPLTIMWVVLVTNAMNLIDGLDGLASGVALVACIAVLLMPGAGAAERAVAVALAGALLGFLWFNLNPALIFMGDAGSLFTGFVLAALALHAPAGAAPGWFPVVPALALAVPLADTLHAIGRRLLAAAREADSPWAFVRSAPRRMFTADRGHVHHLLQAAGWSPRRAAALLWAAALSFGIAACLCVRAGLPGIAWLVVMVSAWSWVGWRVSLRLRRSPATPEVLAPAPVSAFPALAEHAEEPAPDSARAA